MAKPRTHFNPLSKFAFVSELGRLRETRDWDSGYDYDLRYLVQDYDIVKPSESLDLNRDQCIKLLEEHIGKIKRGLVSLGPPPKKPVKKEKGYTLVTVKHGDKILKEEDFDSYEECEKECSRGREGNGQGDTGNDKHQGQGDKAKDSKNNKIAA